MKAKRVLILGLITLIILAVGGGVWFQWFQTYHYAVVKPSVLYRDGNRDLREFTNAIRKSHAKTVVTLVDPRELNDPAKPQFAAEAAWCQANGVHQIPIPVKLGGWPTTDDVRKFLMITQDPAAQPVLVHCAQGVRRTGMFVAAYQLTAGQQDADQVKAQVLRFGHSQRDVDDVVKFVDLFRPITKELPATMPATSAE